MQLLYFGGVEGPRCSAVMSLRSQFLHRVSGRESSSNQITREGFGRTRFAGRRWFGPKNPVILAGFGLLMLCATASPPQAQSHAEICLPLVPPELPSDARLMREFEGLLRDEFEQYLNDVTEYFRCIDAERDRAWREAAGVTAQYGAFLEALRSGPP